jgi:hypothetical protein
MSVSAASTDAQTSTLSTRSGHLSRLGERRLKTGGHSKPGVGRRLLRTAVNEGSAAPLSGLPPSAVDARQRALDACSPYTRPAGLDPLLPLARSAPPCQYDLRHLPPRDQ